MAEQAERPVGLPPAARVIWAVSRLVDAFAIAGLKAPVAIVVAEGDLPRLKALVGDSALLLVEDKTVTRNSIYGVTIEER